MREKVRITERKRQENGRECERMNLRKENRIAKRINNLRESEKKRNKRWNKLKDAERVKRERKIEK